MMQSAPLINPKALQLSVIMLRQYRPEVAKYLPGPADYPSGGHDIALTLDSKTITEIICALNDIGDTWMKEAEEKPSDTQRNLLRQQCLAFILEEWIEVGEQCQNQTRKVIH